MMSQRVILLVVAMLFCQNSYAQGLNYVGIGGAIVDIRIMVSAIAYLMGGIFFVIAAVRLKHWAEAGNQGVVTHFTIGGPIMHVILGTALIYFASTVTSINASLFNDSVLSAVDVENVDSCDSDYERLFTLALGVIQLAGLIYMVLGFTHLKQLADGNALNSTGVFSRSIVRIFGGSLLLNITAFSSAIAITFGIDDIIDVVGTC